MLRVYNVKYVEEIANMVRWIFAAAIFFVLLPGAASAETVLGRWCDRMLPNQPKYNGIITILVTDGGSVQAFVKYGDGSSRKGTLREDGGNIYSKLGSATGDRYRIVPSTGNLQLIDNDGLIRTATRLENKAQPGECAQ